MIARILLAVAIAAYTLFPTIAFSQAAVGITPCVLPGTSQSGGVVPTSMSVTTSSSRIRFSTCGPTAIIYNTTSEPVYYNVGSSSTITATTSNYNIPGGYYVILNVGQSGLYFAAIVANNSSILTIVQGRAAN